MPAEVLAILALNWVLLLGLAVWLRGRGSNLDKKLQELEEGAR